MRFLELKVPPVALFILVIVASYFCAQQLSTAAIALPYKLIVLGVGIALSGVVGLSGIWEFRKQKTTVNPIKVETASAVVDSGIFGYTRNPMYLGLFILLFCFGYYFQNIFSILLSFVFVIYMNQFQIKPEERVLEQLFGAEYVDYKQKVRRWI
ncbi:MULTISPECIES: isoprenylcysteine carboxylmethyltransferase family protein [unclassified Vibrio]|uniref:methyltransferase family protein n=1 Tax=unclassified Vibrio TaxID=2614977 RepID=UPI00159D96E2|nr:MULTISPECIES: isoprenylcysteine carboxylmethyltransferase family protein [unclassified Vibrio]NVN82993.1 isoprenylcysteine carboxylmethyltransferase family protein [Vibrio sp. Scap16]QLE91844.1 isoprenylcysteine carboxylmethyltransferase family protein [Vibrio sp. Scap24]